MRALIWAAVSSPAQATEERASLPQQITDSRAVIERQGWLEAQEPIVVDGHSRSYTGISPLLDACADMPQYAQLVELARSDKIDVVLCRSRDRLGRTDVLVSEVEGYLRTHGVQVYSLDMPSALQDPADYRAHRDKAGLWTSAIERARAEDEVETLKQRYQFGMRGRIKRGLHPNTVPFGYRKGPDGVGVLFEEEARLVQLVYQWYLEGLSTMEITNRLPSYAEGRCPKSIHTIQRWLRNPYYAGMVAWRRETPDQRRRDQSEWVVADGLHEAIVDKATFDEVQREHSHRPGTRARGTYIQYPLSGLVYCGTCGGRMNVHWTIAKGRKYIYMRCVAKDCNPRQWIRMDKVEETIAEWICEWASNPDELKTALAELGPPETVSQERQALAAAAKQKSAALERWAEDYEAGYIGRGEYYGRRMNLMEEMEQAEAALEHLGEPTPTTDEIADALKRLASGDVSELVESWRSREIALAVQAALRRIGFSVTVKDKEATVNLG